LWDVAEGWAAVAWVVLSGRLVTSVAVGGRSPAGPRRPTLVAVHANSTPTTVGRDGDEIIPGDPGTRSKSLNLVFYILRRLAISIPILLIGSFLVFVMVAGAGDPLAELRTQPKIGRA